MKTSENDGRCHPTSAYPGVKAWLPTSPSAVFEGKPNQSAEVTRDQSTRLWGPGSGLPGSGRLVSPKRRSKIHDRT